MTDFRDGKWARAIVALQHEDGSWGQFHSMAAPYRDLTTEQALRRLRLLGFSIADPPVQRAADWMHDVLAGRREIPDRREKSWCWEMYLRLILAFWIRLFLPDDPIANEIARSWASVIETAFADGVYNDSAYQSAFLRMFGLPPNGGRTVDFVGLYPVGILPGLLSPAVEAAMVRHVLDHPDGLYYIYDRPLRTLPASLSDRRTCGYLGAVDWLARYSRQTVGAELGFVAEWLESSRGADGGWDLGPAAKDGIYLPLSDSWREATVRRADCTLFVGGLLHRLRP